MTAHGSEFSPPTHPHILSPEQTTLIDVDDAAMRAFEQDYYNDPDAILDQDKSGQSVYDEAKAQVEQTGEPESKSTDDDDADLLPIVSRNRDWTRLAACREENPELFFSAFNERGGKRTYREELAIAVCKRCAVIEQCGQYAIDNREPYGVWGGMTEDVRDAVIRRSQRR